MERFTRTHRTEVLDADLFTRLEEEVRAAREDSLIGPIACEPES